MRQLKATGYMHNRLRMIVACFLVKDLFINWQQGEKYFMNNLIDGDLASNNGGWQWVSPEVGRERLYTIRSRILYSHVHKKRARVGESNIFYVFFFCACVIF